MKSPALDFWDFRPYLPAEVKEYIDTFIKDWMSNPELANVLVESCLRHAFEVACLKTYDPESDDEFDLDDETFDFIQAQAEIDSNMYRLIEKGLLEAYETEEGELMIWFTELGVKANEMLKEEDKIKEL